MSYETTCIMRCTLLFHFVDKRVKKIVNRSVAFVVLLEQMLHHHKDRQQRTIGHATTYSQEHCKGYNTFNSCCCFVAVIAVVARLPWEEGDYN